METAMADGGFTGEISPWESSGPLPLSSSEARPRMLASAIARRYKRAHPTRGPRPLAIPVVPADAKSGRNLRVCGG